MNSLTTESSNVTIQTTKFIDENYGIISTIATMLDEIATEYKLPGEEETPPSHKAPLLLYDILIPTFGAVIILLNLVVVISSGLILKKGQQPRSTYMFLGNVALTDLVTGVAVVFGQVFPKKYRDHYVCATQLGMITSSTLASIYSVGLIAIDRYLYILHGLQYQIWVYPVRVRILILSTWFIGCVIGFLPLMGWYGDTDNGRVCWFTVLAPKELILLTVIIGIIPLLVVVVLYSIILYRAINKIIQLKEADTNYIENTRETNENGLRIFRGQAKEAQKETKAPSKWKAIKVVMFTTGSFVITWCPYFVASLLYAYCDDKQSQHCKTLQILIASPLAILGFVNGLINPVIYAWWHKGFRTFVKRKYQAIKMTRRGTQEITDTKNSRSQSTSHSTLGSKTSSSSTIPNAQLNAENVTFNTQL